ncbi:hypothetical protein NCHU2750_42060 (plasmid) [Neorhizobium sp. NCHU2750]|nr:hypothetical protein NCHU2750_42060 [Neorhizobium sp. NCHU2750]
MAKCTSDVFFDTVDGNTLPPGNLTVGQPFDPSEKKDLAASRRKLRQRDIECSQCLPCLKPIFWRWNIASQLLGNKGGENIASPAL